jgi:pyruvate dehydrogenase E1 component
MAFEPAFGQDLEWTFLYALSRLGRPDGSSAYFRLSTRPLDQALAAIPDDDGGREARRRLAVAGGYRLRDLNASAEPGVTIAAVGAIVPEAVAAAEVLAASGLGVDVVCLTSPDLVFRALQAQKGLARGETWILDELFPASRPRPVLGVLDGHPHTLSFLGSIRGVPSTCLGVSAFGQSGALDDLYRTYGIDAETIVGAALDLV